MGNYSPLYHNTFQDKKFLSLSIEARLLFLYLLANPSINLSGIFDLNPKIVEIEMEGWVKGFDANMAELVEKGLVKWDSDNNKVWIINRFKRLVARNSKVIAGAMNSIETLDHPFKEEFVEKYLKTVKPCLYKVQEQSVASFLTQDQMIFLAKIHHSKFSLKRFLMDKEVPESQVDKAIEKFLPHLK